MLPRTLDRPAADLKLVEMIEELEAFADHDRARAARGPDGAGDSAERARQAAADVFHADRLGEIVEAFGWPVAARVGGKAAAGALAAAAHAGHDAALQQRLIEAAAHATDAGRLPASDLAMLIDRARVAAGRPQVFGSVAVVEDGRAVVAGGVEDAAGLDERRAVFGLGTHGHLVRVLEHGAGDVGEAEAGFAAVPVE